MLLFATNFFSVRYFSSKNSKKNTQKKNVNSKKETILPKTSNVLKHYENFETTAAYAKGAAAALMGKPYIPSNNQLTVDQEKNKNMYIRALAGIRMAQDTENLKIQQPAMYLASRVLTGDKTAQLTASRALSAKDSKTKPAPEKPSQRLEVAGKSIKRPKRPRNLYPVGRSRERSAKNDKFDIDDSKPSFGQTPATAVFDHREAYEADSNSKKLSKSNKSTRGSRGGVKARRRRLSV